MNYLKHHPSKSNSWLLVGLSSLVAFALFPYGWLAANWPLFDQFTGFIFGSEVAHVIGHVALFVLLGTVALTIFPRLQRKPVVYFAIISSLGLVQESLQLLTFKHRPVGANDIFDLAVDLLAAGCVFLIWQRRGIKAQR